MSFSSRISEVSIQVLYVCGVDPLQLCNEGVDGLLTYQFSDLNITMHVKLILISAFGEIVCR